MTAQANEAAQSNFSGVAYARVGLLGNPSDGYGGRVLAMTVPALCARVRVASAERWSFADSERNEGGDGSELLAATHQALLTRRPELVERPATLTFDTTIPRQVGLSGSSAIIMAALRTLAARHDASWDPVTLARVTLEVETDVLGWAAGPQDRVVQAYEGPVDMDFAIPWRADRYHRLDAASLPPLYVAWDNSTGQPSDTVHSDVRARWQSGDTQVRTAMTRFAELAAVGRAALDHHQADEQWPRLLDEAFELRRKIWHLTEVDTALVATGRQLGAGVALAGSGGAVVGAITEPAALTDLRIAYQARGAGFLQLAPQPSAP